ncbi:MAG: PRC-barrel domain-containing protein [Firmicutes bacterium]|nr:PRC-barrel domain-containing protein [Bacillota bacterium]
MALIRSRDVMGMPVVGLNEGEILGRIREPVIVARERRVRGFHLGSSRASREIRILAFDKIRRIGRDVVTVAEPGSVLEGTSAVAWRDNLGTEIDLLGARAVTENGQLVGRVEDFLLDPRKGEIGALLLSGGLVQDLIKGPVLLNLRAVLTLGRDAVIVRDDFEESLSRATGGLGSGLEESVRRLRENLTDGSSRMREVGAEVRRGAEEAFGRFRTGSRHERLSELLVPLGRRIDDLLADLDVDLVKAREDLQEAAREGIRAYTLGKRVAHEVKDGSGPLILAGERVDDLVVEEAGRHGRLPELFIAVLTNELSEGLDSANRRIKEVIGR